MIKIQQNFAGSKQSFFGPADYAQAQFNQAIKPVATQAMAVGGLKKESEVVGYDKKIYAPKGTKQTLMGASIISEAQTFQTWQTKEEKVKEEEKVEPVVQNVAHSDFDPVGEIFE